MRVATSQTAGTPVIAIEGEVDHSTATQLHEAIQSALAGGTAALLLDLRACDYIDSGGIAVILGTVRRLRGEGWLGVISPNSNLRRLFDIVGLTLDDGFRIFEDLNGATSAVRAPT